MGKTSEEELSRAIAQGGRRGQIYAGLAALRDRYAAAIRARFPDIPRRVSGYNLPYLLPEKGFDVARALVGSEGTCVTVLEATLHLIERPRARALVVAGFSDVYAAARAVPEILVHHPIGLEGFDDRLVSDTRAVGANAASLALLPAGSGWLIVEFGGATRDEAESHARRLEAKMPSIGGADTRVYGDPAQADVWRVRESALGVTAHVPGRPILWEGWEDSAVPPEKLADYMRDLRARSWAGTATREPSTDTSGRDVSIPRINSISRRRRASLGFASSSTRRRTWSLITEDRFRASTATDRRARSFCRRCSARSWSTPSGSSSASGIRRAG